MNRRNFLTAAALALGTRVPHLLAQPTLKDNPFTLGVASGDPWPDSVVLWTRLMQVEMPHAAIPGPLARGA